MNAPVCRAEVEASLTAKILAGIKHHGDDAAALAADIVNDAVEFYVAGIERGVLASHSPAMGTTVWNSITRQNDEPNGKLVPGQSRQRTSKQINFVRANLGLPPESVNRSHPTT